MPPAMQRCSLYRDACRAADDYRTMLLKRAGPEVGQSGSSEWNREHWWSWAGQRVVEHLTGEAFWVELDAAKFASISSETPERKRLLDELRGVDARLKSPTLLPFEEKQQLQHRWAEIVNRLLD